MDLLAAMKEEEAILTMKLKKLQSMIADYSGENQIVRKKKVSAKTRAKMREAAKKRWAAKKKQA